MRLRLLGHHIHRSVLALALVEALLFVLAIVLAVGLRFGLSYAVIAEHFGQVWPQALLFSAVMLISLLAFGLHTSRQRAPTVGILLRVLIGMAAGAAVIAVLFYVYPDAHFGRGVLAIAVALATVFSLLARLLFLRLVDEDIFKRVILVYGAGKRAMTVAGLRRRADRRGFHVAGFVPAHHERITVPADRLLASDKPLADLCEEHEVSEVVVAMDDRRRNFPIDDLLACRLSGVAVTELPTFLERETGRVRLDVMNPSWIIFSEGFRRSPLRLLTARMFDICASLILLATAVPITLVTVIAIKLEDGWRAPVFYRQERVGLGGKVFWLLKFRSMRVDAERDGKAIWARPGDSRVTRVGAIIRKARIDELPQLVNVLRGDMSLVGPRPERPQFVNELSQKIPYYSQRHCVKPGVTGWAQLCYPYGSSEHDSLEKLQYDLYYIKNNSLLFDLAILLQTVEVVVLGKGAR